MRVIDYVDEMEVDGGDSLNNFKMTFIENKTLALSLTDREFKFYMSDYWSMAGFQYGGRTKFCDNMVNVSSVDPYEDPVDLRVAYLL